MKYAWSLERKRHPNIKQVKTSWFIYKPIKSLFKDNFTRPKLQQNIKHKTKEQNFALL